MSEERKGQLSKEELARRISGSVSARSNDEIRQREQARKQARDYPEQTAYRQTMGNPYTNEPGRRVNRTAVPQSDARQSQQRRRPQQQMPQGRRISPEERRRRAEAAAKRKKRTKRRIIVGICTFLFICCGAGVGAIVWYTHSQAKYDGIFLDNTYINGTLVEGMTPEEASKQVRKSNDNPGQITLIKPDSSEVKIKLKDIGGTDNIDQNVKNFFNDQDHSQWMEAQHKEMKYDFTVKFKFDEDAFYKEVERTIVKPKSEDKSKDAYIERTPSGFQIVPEVVGTNVDEKKAQSLYDYIDGFLERGCYTIDLKNCNCYKLPKVTEASLRDQLAELNALYDVKFYIDFGYTKELLEGNKCLDWITFENDNPLDGFTVDTDKVEAYVDQLGAKYDTYGKDRKFHSTTRGDITVEQGRGDYGWWIDREKTAAMIADLVHDGISATIEPYYYKNESTGYEYTCETERTKDDDIGNTYCEVDLEKQHFWYYKDGVKQYECDIVSGMPTAERNTPEGVYKIWYKEMNKTLRGSLSTGESWATPVTYWNNISTFGIGLHDATWHPYFGGSRYVEGGSHGCINMPLEAAKYVYENVEIGTPVVMYW